MFKRLLHSLKHFGLVSISLLLITMAIGYSEHASISFGEAPLAYKVGNEGPHVFFEDNKLNVQYIRGSRDENFSVESITYTSSQAIPAEAYFALDDSRFQFTIMPLEQRAPNVYEDGQPIFAVSDLEGNFNTFRQFLINNNVITPELNWNFGRGHLVLLGDMVDRGYSTTQLLWLIYKLDQEAKQAGGVVHYILGNHELKNLQGNVLSAADKYTAIAGFFGKTYAELLGENTYLGRWLASKNIIEKINGHLFVHGGLHPELANQNWSIEAINAVSQGGYRQMYYPGIADDETSMVLSTETGPAWFRGYFKEAVTERQFVETLTHFDAQSVVVGHTIQFRVNSQFSGRLFAIDVKHPNDYRASFPIKNSEGLYIEGGNFYRVLDDGEKIQL